VQRGELCVVFGGFVLGVGFSVVISVMGSVAAGGRAHERYVEPFLSDEPGAWSTPLRERLRAKFVLRLSELCDCYEQAGLSERAEALCLKGLEAEPLAERLYVKLMTSYASRGLQSEVSSVYRRCQRTLLALTGAPPSADTEAAYRELHSSQGQPRSTQSSRLQRAAG
jgi:two-component SAPR family response regulator